MPTKLTSSLDSFDENSDERIQDTVPAMSRPGPKSVKRKRLQELQSNSQEVSGYNPQPINLQGQERSVIALLHQRTSHQQPKRHRTADPASQQSNSSASTSATNSRQVNNTTSNEDAIPVPAAPILRSPKSSKMVISAPPIGPTVPRVYRSMSSSLSSNDEAILVRPTTSNRVLTPPRVSPPLPPAVRRSPPNDINDGNAHTNGGAPRRVNWIQPTPPAKSTRHPRPIDKSIHGG